MSGHQGVEARITHIMTVSTECEPGREAEFEDWYHRIHLPQVMAVEGMESAEQWALDGDVEGENRWLTTYRLSAPTSEVQAALAQLDLIWTSAYRRPLTKIRSYTLNGVRARKLPEGQGIEISEREDSA
ncbi:hypothetical protein [Glaciibacter sp. 2TAF33]|uniref:hypothetical protein n=1 Tax=Glaciibacter sp. 2TAF33 TaxID=3233015 RepID=UPI003F9155B2